MHSPYIYSQRYPLESFYTSSAPMQLTFHRMHAPIMTDNDFIKTAIKLSKRERIGLDILQRNDKIFANFYSKSLFISDESTALWESLIAASHRFEIFIPHENHPTITMRFGRIKDK